MSRKLASVLTFSGLLMCAVFMYGLLDGFDRRHQMTTPATLSGSNKGSAGEPPYLVKTFLSTKDAVCKPVENIVYIKTHKTGSTTLATLIYRYGYQRNASFLFSRTQRLGHFRHEPLTVRDLPDLYPPRGVFYGDYQNYKFNISASHVIYNRRLLDLLMCEDTKYITIIREPVKQFASYFAFFGFPKRYMKDVKIESEDPLAYLEEFLQNIDIYEKRKTPISFNGRTKKNPQFFDLGLPIEKMDDVEYVKRALFQLDAEFNLVLITEYFDESLVLLKRELCWTMDDIVYFRMNVRHSESAPIPQQLQEKIKQWNEADVLLYEHFNKTLWRKIREYGPTFQTDLETFRRRLRDLKPDCIESYRQVNSRIEEVLKENASPLCRQIHTSTYTWFRRIVGKQPVVTVQSASSSNHTSNGVSGNDTIPIKTISKTKVDTKS